MNTQWRQRQAVQIQLVEVFDRHEIRRPFPGRILCGQIITEGGLVGVMTDQRYLLGGRRIIRNDDRRQLAGRTEEIHRGRIHRHQFTEQFQHHSGKPLAVQLTIKARETAVNAFPVLGVHRHKRGQPNRRPAR